MIEMKERASNGRTTNDDDITAVLNELDTTVNDKVVVSDTSLINFDDNSCSISMDTSESNKRTAKKALNGYNGSEKTVRDMVMAHSPSAANKKGPGIYRRKSFSLACTEAIPTNGHLNLIELGYKASQPLPRSSSAKLAPTQGITQRSALQRQSSLVNVVTLRRQMALAMGLPSTSEIHVEMERLTNCEKSGDLLRVTVIEARGMPIREQGQGPTTNPIIELWLENKNLRLSMIATCTLQLAPGAHIESIVISPKKRVTLKESKKRYRNKYCDEYSSTESTDTFSRDTRSVTHMRSMRSAYTPVWEQTFEFDIGTIKTNSSASLRLVLSNWDALRELGLIASADIAISRLPLRSTIEKWIKLTYQPSISMTANISDLPSQSLLPVSSFSDYTGNDNDSSSEGDIRTSRYHGGISPTAGVNGRGRRRYAFLANTKQPHASVNKLLPGEDDLLGHNSKRKYHFRKCMSVQWLVLALVTLELVLVILSSVLNTNREFGIVALHSANTILHATGFSALQELTAFFLEPVTTVVSLSTFVAMTELPNDTSLMEHAFRKSLETSFTPDFTPISNITSIYVSDTDGIFVQMGLYMTMNETVLERLNLETDVKWMREGGILAIQSVNPFSEYKLTKVIFAANASCPLYYDWDCELKILPPLIIGKDYDALNRPWYLQGETMEKPGWTKPYVFATKHNQDRPTLGITAVSPIFLLPASNQLTNVLAVDLYLSDIDTFLETLVPYNHSLAFLIDNHCDDERKYCLLAASDRHSSWGSRACPGFVNGSTITCTPAYLSCSLTIREASKYLIFETSQFPPPKQDYYPLISLDIDDGYGPYFANMQPYRDGFGLDITVVVLVPKSEFLDPVTESFHHSILVGFGLATFFVCIMALCLRLFLGPLDKSTKQLLAFAHMNFEDEHNALKLINSPIKEVARVSFALNSMRAALESFMKYVPPQVVHYLIKTNQVARLGCDRSIITVSFSDIVNFTSLSEKLDIDLLIELMGEYLEEMSNIVNAHDGTVDKYIGDAIMALWNAPEPIKNHELEAVRTALASQQRLHDLKPAWKARGFPHITARIGIHTGHAVVGNIGSLSRLNYTALGDTVNVASRLEELNKEYGTSIMISQNTYEAIKDTVLCRPLDVVAVKGKSNAVMVYEVIGLLADTTVKQRTSVSLYTHALNSYLAQNFENGQLHFRNFLDKSPEDIAAKRHLSSCQIFVNNPPSKDWNGVRIMLSK